MPTPMTAADATALLPYASTHYQRAVLEAIAEHGGVRAAQRALGLANGSVSHMVSRVKARAALQGYSPDHDWNNPVPPTHIARGVSTFYNLETGQATRQWVKADLDAEKREALIRESIEGFKSDIPKAKPVPKPKAKGGETLCNMYLITDFHLGMKAWHEECGEDYDLAIAEDLLVKWFSKAVASAPAAKQAVFAQLGDFLHWDGLEAVTPTNKHVLDADTRYQKVVRTAIRVLRRVTKMLLEKHESVHIIMADANHDPAGSAWLREAFAVFYEGEPRITVDTSPDTYYAFQWGKTALFFHHGHRKKLAGVADVFAAKFRSMYGETEFAYGHTGHYHHRIVLEGNLMPIEQHRTLAAKDGYAALGGYIAGRDAPVITYSSEYGEVGRVVISPRMATA